MKEFDIVIFALAPNWYPQGRGQRSLSGSRRGELPAQRLQVPGLSTVQKTGVLGESMLPPLHTSEQNQLNIVPNIRCTPAGAAKIRMFNSTGRMLT